MTEVAEIFFSRAWIFPAALPCRHRSIGLGKAPIGPPRGRAGSTRLAGSGTHRGQAVARVDPGPQPVPRGDLLRGRRWPEIAVLLAKQCQHRAPQDRAVPAVAGTVTLPGDQSRRSGHRKGPSRQPDHLADPAGERDAQRRSYTTQWDTIERRRRLSRPISCKIR